MKLYYSPNACSLGIHFLLEEIGQPFELSKVDFGQQAQYQPPFTDLNPKSKVPALLRDNGEILTEFPAIAVYLARLHPEKNLMPTDIDGEAKALELLDYMVATMHMRGFTRIFRPAIFTANPDDKDKVQAQGAEIILRGFQILEPVLSDQDFILGKFSVVEAALLFLEYWAVYRAKLSLPPSFQAHLQRLLARPAAQRAFAAEGLPWRP